MNIAVPSRFACLKIEDDEDRKKSQNNTKKPKQEDKKPLKSGVSSNSSVNSKKSSTSSKQNGVTNKKQKQKQQVKVQQWEEWKQRDDELVNNNFEEELQSAILQSKMDFQKQNRVIKLSSNAISSKKKKNKTMSLDEFKSMESGDGDNNSNGLKTENNEEELLEVMMKQVKEEVCRGKIEEQRKEREASIDEIITSAQFQQRLEKEKSTNERLRQELELVKKDMAAVKERNKTLCSILGHGEMKEKADVLLELERLGSVKNELTEEVSRLHTLLEQERSKVAGLLAEKHKDKILIKSNGTSRSKRNVIKQSINTTAKFLASFAKVKMANESLNLTMLGVDYNLSHFNNITSLEGNFTVLPDLLKQNFPAILVYSCIFVLAAVGNLTVFISLFRSRHRKSRISLMIRHLAIADLIVTFIMIPIEVGWRITGSWIAGNIACKVFLFLRAFGPYLSSNVLICISLDRYFAVLHPLKVNDARRRGKVMLACAWGTSFVYCIPQLFIFKVLKHPEFHYDQCVSFYFFSSTTQEIAYNVMCLIFMYFIPFFVIISAYSAIMCEISKNSKDTKDSSTGNSNGRLRLRRSDISNIERARARTLRMTIAIVVVYLWCCTPYVLITMWYMLDRDSATKLPEWLQDLFFMMVVSNSCMNPILYGSFVINFKRANCNCFSCFGSMERNKNLTNPPQTLHNNGQSRIIARAVIKRVIGLHKESAATKCTVANQVSKSKQQLLEALPNELIKKRKSSRSMGHITLFQSEPRALSRSNKASFHSEPCKHLSMSTSEASEAESFKSCIHINMSNSHMLTALEEPLMMPP